jgi:hypothetical protein
VVSVGTYVVGALSLVVVGISIGFSAFRLRKALLPGWEGAPARLVEAVTALALPYGSASSSARLDCSTAGA